MPGHDTTNPVEPTGTRWLSLRACEIERAAQSTCQQFRSELSIIRESRELLLQAIGLKIGDVFTEGSLVNHVWSTFVVSMASPPKKSTSEDAY
jgi:hypothetical protein